MTYQPGHSHHPHTRFAQACARLSRGLAWVYDHTRPHHHEVEWDGRDDKGNHVGDLVGDVELPGRDGWPEDDGRTVIEAVRDAEADEDGWPGGQVRDGESARSPVNAPAYEAPRPPEDVPGSVTPSAGGPGYFHDDGYDGFFSNAPPCDHEYTPNLGQTHEWCQKCDSIRVIEPGTEYHDGAPAEARQAVLLRDGTLLMKTPGEPPAYDPREIDDTIVSLRPEPRSGAAAWATQLRRDRPRTWVDDLVQQCLGVPTVELYLWNWQQRRAIAA